MVAPIDSKGRGFVIQNDSANEISPKHRNWKSSLDEIRFGKQSGSCLSDFLAHIHSFFYWIYSSFFKAFEWMGCYSKEEIIQSKLETDLETLESFLQRFTDKGKYYSEDFKEEWKNAFGALHPDVKYLLLLEDVMTWVPKDEPNEEKWAEKNYKAHRAGAYHFVVELEPTSRDGKGNTYDPFHYIPVFIENVIKKLKVKIQEEKKLQTRAVFLNRGS